MSNGIMNLIIVGVLGIVAFMIVRSVATSMCNNVVGWSQTETVLICQIVGIVVATAVILFLFGVMQAATGRR